MSTVANVEPKIGMAKIAPIPSTGLQIRCPQCTSAVGGLVVAASAQQLLTCPLCHFHMQCVQGIWKALSPMRERYFERFVQEYQIVRAKEGRGSHDPEYYFALPYRDITGNNQSQWTIRARTFQYLERKVLPFLEATHPGNMDVMDLGAGNGWLSYRLALCGHRPVAIDLLTNNTDGLGAAVHYQQELPVMFPRFQAELDHLPFADNQFDCAIFNASFHYSENYEQTLGETIRCLRPGGTVIITDSPWYRHDESGRRMLEERRNAFIAKFGFPSDSCASLEYLTDERLLNLVMKFGLRWQIYTPFYGIRWTLRPLNAKLRGTREPSRFRIYVSEMKK